jgi:hypothetical protein
VLLQNSISWISNKFVYLTIFVIFSRYGRSAQEETTVTQKPRFLGPLKGTNKIVEGQKAHFEARVEPQNDMTLQVSKILSHHILMNSVFVYFPFTGLFFVSVLNLI